jgi:DNA-binding beta-propeller fold protein YncE
MIVLAAAALCLVGADGFTAPGPSGLAVTAKIAGPDGGWDYASFDPARRRVYVAHGASVLMIDADTSKVTPSFAEGSHLHAVTPVPGTDLIVTTNSGDNTARVISATDGHLIASIAAAKDTDSAVFDPSSGYVLAIGGDSGEITLVDAKAGKAAGSIVVGGGLEFGAVDGKGRLFINSEEKHEVAVIDIAARKVIASYAMPTCMRPTGLALVSGDRIISACANGVAEILDAATGREIAALKIGERPDAVIYDPTRSLAYIPSGHSGTLAVIALTGPANNTVIDTVATAVGARTGTVDPRTGRIYLPSAEYAPPAQPGQRPAMKPGTFAVLVLDR